MKKKLLPVTAIVICAVLLFGLIAVRRNAGMQDAAVFPEESIAPDAPENSVNPDPAGDEENESKKPISDDPATEPENISSGNTQSGGSSYSNTPQAKPSREPEVDKTLVTFPYVIPNADLTIQNIASYDGIFLEDGSDVTVSGVSSAILVNTGVSDVEFAKITLDCNGTTIAFEVSDLPAGASVAVQESSRAPYESGTYRNCVADVAHNSLTQSSGQISVQENEDGSLTVSNLTDSLIPCVRVFYKFYMSDENVYVGGITYTAKLTDLEAGSSQTIIPSHYSLGYSKVVMVRTYDTKD